MNLELTPITPSDANEAPPGTVILAKFDSIVEGDDRPNNLLIVKKNDGDWHYNSEASKRGTAYLDLDDGYGMSPKRVFNTRHKINLELYEVYRPQS